MTLPKSRKVTHEMAREAYFKLHNAVYYGGPVPTLTIPRSIDDVDCILCDYIEQQEALDGLPPDQLHSWERDTRKLWDGQDNSMPARERPKNKI